MRQIRRFRGVGPVRGPGWSLIAALLLAACQGDASPGHAGQPIVLSAVDVHVVATSDALARIVDVQPAGDGRVWVLNSTEPFFVAVGADGHVERAFGREGGGPEEFGGPVELARGPAGEVWTYDVPRNALRRISDERPRDLRLPSDSLPPGKLVSFQDAGMRPAPPWIQSRGTGFLVGRKRPSAPPAGGLGIWRADIVWLGLDAPAVSLEPSTPVADLLGDPTQRYPGATLFLPYPIWTSCGDGSLGMYDPLANTLRRLAPDGGEEQPIALPEERREPVTFDRFFGMVYRQLKEQVPSSQLPDSAHTRSILQEQFRRSDGTLADVFPEYADLRCTDGGTLWLQPFDVAGGRFGRGSEWIRFDADGSRTTIVLPDAFTVHRIEDDRLWGAVVDSLGVPAVAWVRVEG